MHEPKPHQERAIAACAEGLREPGSRGQCLMACGTGKTLVGLEVAKKLKAQKTLVLVPSLLLVNQMVREYRAQGVEHLLCVCCDDGAGGEDAIQVSVKELEASNTTNADEARAFLSGAGGRFVICTYQSLRNLSEVFDGLSFDLAIFDEAHKTAGGRSKLFAHALTDDGVRCSRRLFMTATPRHAKLNEDGTESQVYAMNDPKVYGPVLFSLPLRRAIDAGIIDDYRIVVAVVSQPAAEELRDQAIRVAIDQAVEQFGIRKVFTFHARVAEAAAFVLGATDTLKAMRLYHVSGQQTSIERALKLEGFRNSDHALMSNARCLTEGVDLPAADMVAFLSPKKNPIDIVQAVGRVLRKHRTKTEGGFVFLPVFVRDGQDEETAIAESDWSGVYEVLQAMREQDEPLAAALRKYARSGEGLPDTIAVMNLREADFHGVTEMMRRTIAAKVLQPFKIDRRNTDEVKRRFIEMARAGQPRPKYRSEDEEEKSLGQRLSHYLSKVDIQYDAEFERELKKANPSWVYKMDRRSTDEVKRRLIEMAMAGQPRPKANSKDGEEKGLGQRLSSYTSESINSSRQYDAEFDQKIRAMAPHWFDAKADAKKAELLAMARDGSGRPSEKSKEKSVKILGRALGNYTRQRSGCYDAAFCAEIRATAPQWFKARTKAGGKQ